MWNDTIEAHRRLVRDRILDTTEALVTKHGPLGVTMSRIAEETGIGRATLYKYFSDVEAILAAWHDRQIEGHIAYLAKVRDQVGDAGDAGDRLAAVLEAFALHHHEHQTGELSGVLHRSGHMAETTHHLHGFLKGILIDGAKAGELRDDVAPDELAGYCLHALTAAGELSSKAAIRRLIELILSGLRT